MEQLQGKTAVITGGASGIGRALADRFAAEGMRLALGDIEEDALARAVDELDAAGAEVIGVRTDVAELADVEALRDRAIEQFGAVHVVCNNAGVAGGSVIDSPIEVWRWVMGVNLWGVVHGCHVFLPLLLEQDEGHIVNTASIAGLAGAAGLGVYCTTKFGVVGLSDSLFQDLAARSSNVGVSVLCPGFVNTRIYESDRNMPDHVRAATGRDPAGDEVTRTVVGLGIPAADVAELVLAAVRERHFFVLPHERAALRIGEDRVAWMRGDEAAALDLESLVRP
ncbi:MAG TPA: SDR family NAD(P)-dependent oxidoreductase [Acidimicrobiia bacterium]